MFISIVCDSSEDWKHSPLCCRPQLAILSFSVPANSYHSGQITLIDLLFQYYIQGAVLRKEGEWKCVCTGIIESGSCIWIF